MSQELSILLAWCVGLGLTWYLTPWMMKLAHRTGLIDVPRGRHAHTQSTPLLGGGAMYLAIVVAAALFAHDRIPLISAATLAFLVGLLDDYRKTHGKDLGALPKLVMQFAPAVLLVLWGVTVDYVRDPLHGGLHILSPWISIPLTIGWVVGMTNAVNFMDGMDGLAAGVTSVAAFTLVVLAITMGDYSTATWVAAILGACLAFLRFNFHPAKIFMGDAGSNFLGFLLAAIAVNGYFKTATLAGMVVPFFALGLPALNVVFVVFRRLRNGKKLHEAFAAADLEHSFNVLNRKGLNKMETVLVMLLAAMVLSAGGLSFALLHTR